MPSKAQPVTKDTSSSIPDWLTSASQAGVTNAQGATAYTPYSGQGAAPMTPAQMQAITEAMGNAGGAQGVSMGALPGYANAMSYNAPQMTGASVGGNIQGLLSPYTQSNVNAANAQIDKNTATSTSNTDMSLAAQHAFGGDRQALADADVQNQGGMTKASTDAGIYTNDYQNALSAAMGIGTNNQNASIAGAGVNLAGTNGLAGLGTTLGGLNMNDLQGLLSSGGVQQATNQNADTFNVGQYSQAYNSQYQQMQALAQMLSAAPHGTTGTSTTTSYSNPWLQAAGIGLGAAGAFASGGTSLIPGLLSGGGGQFGYSPNPNGGGISPGYGA